MESKKELSQLKQLSDNKYIDFYYGDASHFSLVPNIPYAWQRKDEPVLLPSIRGKALSVFGLVNTEGNLFFDVFESSVNSETLICFFDRFVQKITKKTVVVLDNSSLHTSRKFKEKFKEWEEMDLLIYFIPPYCPELNKIEILWRFIKYRWLKFEAYISFENLKINLNEILQNYGTKYIINYV